MPVFRGGELVYQTCPRSTRSAPTAPRQLATRCGPEVLRFDYPHNYYVDLSEKLLKIKLDLLNAGGKSQG